MGATNDALASLADSPRSPRGCGNAAVILAAPPPAILPVRAERLVAESGHGTDREQIPVHRASDRATTRRAGHVCPKRRRT
jgi:hypothetical protein